jgi:hypothetical protein
MIADEFAMGMIAVGVHFASKRFGVGMGNIKPRHYRNLQLRAAVAGQRFAAAIFFDGGAGVFAF